MSRNSSSNPRTRKKLAQLHEIFKETKTLLIVLQDNPDPDSIASAMALRKLANTIAEIQCSIAHGGHVGRAENRALVHYLSLNLRPISEIDFHAFDLLAVVDTQPWTGNNSLPAEMEPDIVIDHHKCRQETRNCRFTDIRSGYGATVTILYEYLLAARIEIDSPLATAMLYAIRSDTQDLGRDTTKADLDVVLAVYPIANKRMLSEIQRGRVERNYYQMLSDGLRNARVFGPAVVTGLGTLENPDMIAEIAALLWDLPGSNADLTPHGSGGPAG
jgi:nanoRNase/pAp phosphatase (c-di-AMP/oligoRNAs hydrolase)